MPNILKVQNLSKSFGGVKAVHKVSFELAEGQLLAMIGPNGAGKSTCFNLINGQLRPDRGNIIILGKKNQWISTQAGMETRCRQDISDHIDVFLDDGFGKHTDRDAFLS